MGSPSIATDGQLTTTPSAAVLLTLFNPVRLVQLLLDTIHACTGCLVVSAKQSLTQACAVGALSRIGPVSRLVVGDDRAVQELVDERPRGTAAVSHPPGGG